MTATAACLQSDSGCFVRSTARATNSGWRDSISPHAGAARVARCLRSLFATPPGQKTHIVRVHRDSNSIKDLQSLLVEFGFTPIGDSTHLRWFLHNDAPDALSLRARSAVTTQNALN